MLFDFPRGLLLLKAGTGRLVEDTASGNPLAFNTNAAKPLKSLLIPFTPTQSGTGDPSPENVRPITGITGLTIYHSGKNLFDKNAAEENKAWWKWNKTPVPGYYASDKIPVVPNGTYYITKKTGNQNAVCLFNKAGTYLDQLLTVPNPLTIPAGVYYIGFSVVADGLNDCQFEARTSASTYAPFVQLVSIPIDWTDEAGTVYGGTLDLVTGVLTVEWYEIVLTGEQDYYTAQNYIKSDACDAYVTARESPSSHNDAYCNQLKKTDSAGIWGSVGYPNYYRVNGRQLHFNIANDLLGITDYTQETAQTVMAKMRAYLKDLYDNGTPIVFVAKLATPQTIQLDPVTVNALVGDNTIWSDTNGENTAVYLKKA